ncbi:hypothetical protein JYU34_020666 [Plutella xylostella]|uniref:Uncharacterized protein n=1 Tax=Plutella xylostella TaxID=51655 RepID=A0ABQ7PUS7_PLUXY|nr:hypothetical protein JYU34_020666 [Plutella xylostella]
MQRRDKLKIRLASNLVKIVGQGWPTDQLDNTKHLTDKTLWDISMTGALKSEGIGAVKSDFPFQLRNKYRAI